MFHGKALATLRAFIPQSIVYTIHYRKPTAVIVVENHQDQENNTYRYYTGIIV
jgi:hypothetical protein